MLCNVVVIMTTPNPGGKVCFDTQRSAFWMRVIHEIETEESLRLRLSDLLSYGEESPEIVDEIDDINDKLSELASNHVDAKHTMLEYANDQNIDVKEVCLSHFFGYLTYTRYL